MEQQYVGNIPLDMDNKLFFDAAKLVLETEQQVVYLTGKAGTGKTTFLKYIRQIYDGNMVVLAPTGVAAVNANGQTIHSFFQLDFTPYPPNDSRLSRANMRHRKHKIELIENLSFIVIDEISMVRCDILDAVSEILRIYRNKNSPFGGIKVLMIGDTFQLPPIAKPVWPILQDYYDTPYFLVQNHIRKVRLITLNWINHTDKLNRNF